MRNKCVQMSYEDIYNRVSKSLENKKSKLLSLLEEYINLSGASRALRFRKGSWRFANNEVLPKLLRTHRYNIWDLVDIVEPICCRINAPKADYLIYDTTGIEADVSENNPKFSTSSWKKLAKGNESRDMYSLLSQSRKPVPKSVSNTIMGIFAMPKKLLSRPTDLIL